ncbi:MAG: hypothetical protein ACTHU0_07195 [Kofleriaceae bacterium]
MKKLVPALALLAVLVAFRAARADDDDGPPPWGKPPAGASSAAWRASRAWMKALHQGKSTTLAELSSDGLSVRLVFGEREARASLPRTCRKLDGTILRTRAQMRTLVRCFQPRAPGETAGARAGAGGLLIWQDEGDTDGDPDDFELTLEEVGGKWNVRALTVQVTSFGDEP